MNDFMISLAMLGIAVAFFMIGRAMESKNTLFWKIAWIHREHDCARTEGRKPMNCEEYEKKGHPKLGIEK